MRSFEIYNNILSLSDEELLQTLPTIEKEACSKCNSVNIRYRKRDDSYFCNECQIPTKTIMTIYYFKNKTTSPSIAVERHRIFWNKIYFIELAKENFITPNDNLKVESMESNEVVNITNDNLNKMIKHLNVLHKIYGNMKLKLEKELENKEISKQNKEELELNIFYYEEERKNISDLLIELIIP